MYQLLPAPSSKLRAAKRQAVSHRHICEGKFTKVRSNPIPIPLYDYADYDAGDAGDGAAVSGV